MKILPVKSLSSTGMSTVLKVDWSMDNNMK